MNARERLEALIGPRAMVGPGFIVDHLVELGFDDDLAVDVAYRAPRVWADQWTDGQLHMEEARLLALVARYERRFAGKPPEEWAAIEAQVPDEEHQARAELKRRGLSGRLVALPGWN